MFFAKTKYIDLWAVDMFGTRASNAIMNTDAVFSSEKRVDVFATMLDLLDQFTQILHSQILLQFTHSFPLPEKRLVFHIQRVQCVKVFSVCLRSYFSTPVDYRK